MRGIKNILVLAALCELVSPTIISTPENVALQRGASAELICRVNSGSSVSSWTFTAYQSSGKDVTIYSRAIGMVNNLTSFSKITDKDGFLNIKTDSAQPQDAGIYTCNFQLQEGKGIRVVQRSAHLIVLDSDPNCTAINYSTNGRKFRQLSCSVGFKGNWAPVMEWREGGINGRIVTTDVQSNTSSNFVSHSLTIPVDDGEETTVSYTCVTFFSTYMGNVSATATNIPNYTFTWPAKMIDLSTGTEPSTETKPSSESVDTKKHRLIELTGAFAAVVGVLLLLLVIMLARNYKRYNRDSALVDEAHPINEDHLETHDRVESVRHGIRDGVQPEDSECSRIRGNVDLKSGSSFSAPVDGKHALNQVANDKRSCSYFGSDGTEYMEISSGQNDRPQMPIRNPSRYEQVLYASIDHTLKAPPQPPHV